MTIKDDEQVIEARERALDAARDEALLKVSEGVVDGTVLSWERPRLLRTAGKHGGRPQAGALLSDGSSGCGVFREGGVCSSLADAEAGEDVVQDVVV